MSRHLSHFIGCLLSGVIRSKIMSVQLDHPVTNTKLDRTRLLRRKILDKKISNRTTLIKARLKSAS